MLPLPAGKTRTANVQTRVNQGFFRSVVISAYNGKCCITGLNMPSLLIASHIKPWSDSDPETERTNPLEIPLKSMKAGIKDYTDENQELRTTASNLLDETRSVIAVLKKEKTLKQFSK